MESIQLPHPVFVADADRPVNGTLDEQVQSYPGDILVPKQYPSPPALPNDPLPTRDGEAFTLDTGPNTELEEWRFEKYIYYPEVPTVANEGAITLDRLCSETLEPVNTVPQAVGDRVRNWVQQLPPAQGPTPGIRHEETRVSDSYFNGSSSGQIETYLEYLKPVCAGAYPGPSTNDMQFAQGSSYTCSTGTEQHFTSQYPGSNYDTYSLPRAINDCVSFWICHSNASTF